MAELTDDVETAETAFRRVARRKLIERGYQEEQIDLKITQLLQSGASLRIDVDEILGKHW